MAGDGNFIQFWMDDWLGNGKLVDLCPVLLPAEDLKKSLASHISLHLPWDQIPLVQSLPLEVLDKLQLITPSIGRGDGYASVGW